MSSLLPYACFAINTVFFKINFSTSSLKPSSNGGKVKCDVFVINTGAHLSFLTICKK